MKQKLIITLAATKQICVSKVLNAHLKSFASMPILRVNYEMLHFIITWFTIIQVLSREWNNKSFQLLIIIHHLLLSQKQKEIIIKTNFKISNKTIFQRQLESQNQIPLNITYKLFQIIHIKETKMIQSYLLIYTISRPNSARYLTNITLKNAFFIMKQKKIDVAN